MGIIGLPAFDENSLVKNKRSISPFPDVCMINPLVHNINDMAAHRENVDFIDIFLQRIGDSNNTLFCIKGRVFEGDSLIEGVKSFQLKTVNL